MSSRTKLSALLVLALLTLGALIVRAVSNFWLLFWALMFIALAQGK